MISIFASNSSSLPEEEPHRHSTVHSEDDWAVLDGGLQADIVD